jgi:MYXO-CTERM domain-containing protein
MAAERGRGGLTRAARHGWCRLALAVGVGLAGTAPSAALHAQGVLGSIPLAGGAQGIEVNPATNRVYVAVGTLNQLVAIDGTSHSTLAAVNVGTGPSAVAVNPATNRVYVASSIGNTVSVVDGASHNVLATVAGLAGPAGLDVNPSTNRVYVANNANSSVAVIDGATNAVVGTVPVGAGPRDVAVNPAANRVYVSNAGTGVAPGNTVSVIDGAANTVLATVPVGVRPGVLAVNPTTGRAYVVNQGSGTVSVIDGASSAPVATVNVGGSPVGLAINAQTNHLAVVNAGSNDASVIDGTTNTVIGTVPLGGGAGEVAAHPGLGRFLVASQGIPFGLTVLQDPGGGQLAPAPGGLAAVLRPLGPLSVSGTVTFGAGALPGQTTVNTTLHGVPPGSATSLEVPLSSGWLTVPCTGTVAGSPVTCTQTVGGQPTVGSNVVVSLSGQAVAQGAIVQEPRPAAPAPAAVGASAPGAAALPASLPAGGGAIALAGALLAPMAGSSVNGACNFTTGGPAGATLQADCLLQGVSAGQAVTLSLLGGTATTALTCPPAPPGGTVTCTQAMASAPAPGTQVSASAGGLPVAQGAVASGAQSLPPPVRATAGALLQPAGTAPAGGVVNFSPAPSGAQTAVTIALEGLPPGQQATVQVPIANGPPAPVLCAPASANGQAVCSQVLNGAPLQGGWVTALVGGQPLAQGAVVPGPQPSGAPPAPLLGAPPLPPPPAGPGLLIPTGPPGPYATAPGGVPIVPEADSLVLLGLGLAALGGAALWRRRGAGAPAG